MKELSKWNQTKMFWEGFAIGVMVFAILMLSIPAFASQLQDGLLLVKSLSITLAAHRPIVSVFIGVRG